MDEEPFVESIVRAKTAVKRGTGRLATANCNYLIRCCTLDRRSIVRAKIDSGGQTFQNGSNDHAASVGVAGSILALLELKIFSGRQRVP
jgi:hypothetical protein